MTRVGPLLALLLLGCTPADPDALDPEPQAERASDFRSARVEAAVDAASDVAQTRGFSTLDDSARGFLVEHAAATRESVMRSGTCYIALASASAALRELDLRIFDSDGVEVMRDDDDGPHAALRFCPSHSGTYYETVRAAAGSGLYALRTFHGPTGLEIRTDDLFRDVVTPEPAREGR